MTLNFKVHQDTYFWISFYFIFLKTDGWKRGRMWLVDFNTGKIQLVSFDRSSNTGAIDVKMDGSALEENSSFKMLGLTFTSKLD